MRICPGAGLLLKLLKRGAPGTEMLSLKMASDPRTAGLPGRENPSEKDANTEEREGAGGKGGRETEVLTPSFEPWGQR